MGTCICGNEVRDAPYREPAPMPKVAVVEPPKAQQSEDKTMSNIVYLTAKIALLLGGCIWGASAIFELRTGVHLGLGTLILGITIPIAHLVFVRFPEAVGRWAGVNDGSESDWAVGTYVIVLVPICLATLVGMIYLSATLLIGLGHCINALF